MSGLTAICYHYIARNDEFKRIWGHSFDLFKKHVDFFQNNYQTIGPQDVLLENFEAGKKYFLLTFDDGLKEHQKIIGEYLNRQGIKGVFAVPSCIFRGELLNPQIIHFSSAYYGVREFYEQISSVIRSSFSDKADLLESSPGNLELMELHKKTKQLFKRDFDFITSRQILLEVLKNFLKKDFPDIVDRVHLSKEEIVDLHKNGHAIACHTDSHPVVSEIAENQEIFNKELIQSKKDLEEVINDEVNIFAYPFGAEADILPNPQKIIDAGYSQILTTYQAGDLFNQHHLGRYLSQSSDTLDDLTKNMWEYKVNR